MEKIKLSDYEPYAFELPKVDLDFRINLNYVEILSTFYVVPKYKNYSPLVLNGVDIDIKRITINDIFIPSDSYSLEGDRLTIYHKELKPFSLSILSNINPFNNTSLEGLYSSGGILTTQCEAEGFRRICFHPDRPDVLSRYKVRVESDIKDFPVLLSNGNKIFESRLPGNQSRHEVIWEDPFPKPSYLFALVAGKLEQVKDIFFTSSGKKIDLTIYVEDGDQDYTNHAMSSIKKAMKWDEQVYGLEYDLGEFNIVAIRHFNMGAMENKGLNIFNSKLVLADDNITTDSEFERIESVIAHEYFHNWTGNRVTCRDWFQLSLKEGLTVFRDQSFTSDLHSSALKRIEDVTLLRSFQFPEDAGPTSHAVKPSEYVAIDNFYTTTIYEKGAELIRMIHTLLGHELFMCGINTYFKCFDGSAATTEDFVFSMVKAAEDCNHKINFDVNQFLLWYYQSGTPMISVNRLWDPEKGTLRLAFQQKFKEKKFKPLLIPIEISLLLENGQNKKDLLILREKEQVFEFSNLSSREKMPIISIFRNFSAPVKWQTDLEIEEILYLIENESDLFSIWDSIQFLMSKCLINIAIQKRDKLLEKKVLSVLNRLFNRFSKDNRSFLASLITIPTYDQLESSQDLIDPISLTSAREKFNGLIGTYLQLPLLELLKDCKENSLSAWPQGQGERKLIEMIWTLLIASGNREVRKEILHSVSGHSMTISIAALKSLQCCDCEERKEAMDIFYKKWQNNPVVLDSWFSLEASIPRSNSLLTIKGLLDHPRFDPLAPNSIRAVLGGFAKNTTAFHSFDGRGYRFMAEQIKFVDNRNAITASRLSKVFSRWRSYIEPNSREMFEAISYLNDCDLSDNTREVVELLLH